MHMQIKVGSWDQLYFNFIIVPAAAAADEAGGGAAGQYLRLLRKICKPK